MMRRRFRIRTLMIAVAAAALTLAAVVTWRRVAEFRRRADSHRQFSTQASIVGSMLGLERARTAPVILVVSREEEHCYRLAEHHAALGRKYDRAARSPWLTVEPDPPPPE